MYTIVMYNLQYTKYTICDVQYCLDTNFASAEALETTFTRQKANAQVMYAKSLRPFEMTNFSKITV